ncbi:hypothetical protein F4813DRAFT_376088, partial [Daldinia decipiens]|uniref:uncharacterized protein n=1 Tax=Daldinia decipiens TaxID=326647 RepID=UPI0020C4B295
VLSCPVLSCPVLSCLVLSFSTLGKYDVMYVCIIRHIGAATSRPPNLANIHLTTRQGKARKGPTWVSNSAGRGENTYLTRY